MSSTAHLFRAGELRFTIDVADADLAERLQRSLCDLAVASPAHRSAEEAPSIAFTVAPATGSLDRRWVLWRDGELCESHLADDYVIVNIVWEVTRWHRVRQFDALVVHAGAVSRNGRAVIVAGASMAGKSTAVAWLTACGEWSFVADETAAIDADAYVRPFWRPIGLRPGGPLDRLLPGGEHRLRGDHLVAASTLGSLGDRAPLAAIVIVHQSNGSAEPVRMTGAAAACALAEHLPLLADRGADEFERLGTVVRRTPVVSLDISDLDAAERALRALVEARS